MAEAMAGMTHYVFRSIWLVNAPVDDVFSVLADLWTYPAWWPEIRTVVSVGDGRVEMVARSLLPYELRFVSEDRAVTHQPGVLDARITGDLEGFARWTVKGVGPGCRIVYDQEVDTNRGLLTALAPIARPAFRMNHALMMRHGRSGLRTFMAGYRRAVSGPPEG